MPRPKKVGLKRIDAAVDALVPFGFPKDLVCKIIKKLLRVYDGDNGWVFIEEGGYRLVIEAILEEQELQQGKVEEEGNIISGSKAVEISEPVVECGGTNIHLETIADRPHSEDAAAMDHVLPHGQLDYSKYNLPWGEEERQINASLDVRPLYSQQPTEPSRRRRPPCYGWISESSKG